MDDLGMRHFGKPPLDKPEKKTQFFGQFPLESILDIQASVATELSKIIRDSQLEEYACFLKWGYLQIIHFNGIFHSKVSSYGGTSMETLIWIG